MIISRTERKWTIAMAVLMLLAAVSYLIVIDVQVLPESGLTWSQLKLSDLIFLLIPALMLTTYAIALLLFYKQRGWHHLNSKCYQGSKFPWL
jgi:hypothetical protein